MMLEAFFQQKKQITDHGQQILYITDQFLNSPYLPSPLVGDPNTPEQFVTSLDGFDCMTLIETVEALRTATSSENFTDTLKKIRYQNGVVSYLTRNHFFTDWIEHNGEQVADFTKQLSRSSQRATKHLKLLGLSTTKRTISYIPTECVNAVLIAQLQTGDYVGIYTDQPELDVTHVGILVKHDEQCYFRHASSRAENRKVVDEGFVDYVAGKPGVIVLRPRSERG